MIDGGLGVVVFCRRLHKGFSRQKDDAQNRSKDGELLYRRTSKVL